MPGVSPERVIGFVHGDQAAPSKLHSNVAPFSSDSSAKVTDVDVTARPDGGPPAMRAPGGVRSTRKENEAGSSSSPARTRNVCVPSGRPGYARGEVQGCQSWPPSPPKAHSKLAPGSGE